MKLREKMFIYLKNLILTHERCEQLNFYIQALKGIAVGYNVHGQVQQMETHLRNNLYFCTVHVVIFILFKPTHALFLKHIHIHI